MLGQFLKFTGEVVLETIWPTRCAICDTPGENVLCEGCKGSLLLNDSFKACPKCGAPFGRTQCTECNDTSLNAVDMKCLPLDTMAHAMLANDDATRIIKIYKDSDERRLLDYIASRIAAMISPDRKREHSVVTYIPDTAKAKRRRGFDHAEEIARSVADRAGLACATFFETPRSIDQRQLDKRARLANMKDALHVKEDMGMPKSVLIVDDICTTGATIYSAALALRDAGAQKVHAVTFAKV